MSEREGDAVGTAAGYCVHDWSEGVKAGQVSAMGLVADKMLRLCLPGDKEEIRFRRWRCAACEGHSVHPELIGRAIEEIMDRMASPGEVVSDE